MNRGQKVPSCQCPAKERHRGSVGDGGHRLLGEWFSLPSGGIAPLPAPQHLRPAHRPSAWSSVHAPRNRSPTPARGPATRADLERKCDAIQPCHPLSSPSPPALEFPTGHRGWEKGQGRARRPAWRLRAEAAAPRPPLPPPVARSPTSRQHSSSGWLLQPEGSRADVTSELLGALALALPWASRLLHRGALEAQRTMIVPRESTPTQVRASLSAPCAVSEMILFKTFFFSCM